MQTAEETYKRLRFELEDHNGAPYCKAWRGKARKPFAYYRFRSPERRSEWIAEQKVEEDAREEYKAKRKAEDAEKLAEMVARVQVGTILYTSWGYDQTNVEFFEVVARKGKRTAVLREIAADQEQTGFMSGKVTPRPGGYIGDPIERRIGPYGLRIDDVRSAWVHEGGAKGNSWYH